MKIRSIVSLALVLTLVSPAQVFAVGSGGFENASFSARSLAESNAVVAQADEPAAISYNPAGITQLRGLQAQGSTAFISLFTKHSGRNGDSHYSSGTISVVPTAHLTINPGKIFNDRIVFGIGSDSPFGLANKYDSNQAYVHYTGYKNWIKMYTIKPVLAAKITEWLSIGAGPMWYRIFDAGQVLAYPNLLAVPGAPDGQWRYEISGNRWGWQMGILAKPHKKHQFGFYFRSPVTMTLRGRIKVENASPLLGNPNFETGGHAKVALPLNFTWGYAFKPTDKLTLETDFGFTRWSTLDRFNLVPDPTGSAGNNAILAAIGPTDRDSGNSPALHLGGNYKLMDRLTFRAGWHFYWTPVPKLHFRPSVPDSNSMGYGIGGSYAWKNFVFDAGYYNRIWFRRTIDNTISEALGTSVDGKYFSYAQEFIFSFTYKWEDLFDKLFGREGGISASEGEAL